MAAKLKLNQHQIDEIIKVYTTTSANQADIAKSNNVGVGLIRKVLRKNNIKTIKSKRTKYPYNEQFFLNENYKTAYFFGFVLGDGCLIQNTINHAYRLCIGIQKSDECILQQFCDWTNRSHKAIMYRKNQNVCLLEFCNKNLFNNSYEKWGLVPNKTYNPVEPNFNLSLMKSFIIGLLDADGHVVYNENKNYTISFVNSKVIINWFIKTLRVLGFRGKINYTTPKSYKNSVNFPTVYISRKQDIIELSKILEIDKCNFCLDRKWKTIKAALKNESYKINKKLKFNENQVKKIINIYKTESISINKISKIYKINKQIIKKILNGTYFSQTKKSLQYQQFQTEIIPIRNRKFSEKQCEEIRNLYNKKVSVVYITKKYNAGKNLIYDIINFKGAYKKI